jgi:hypothetical protein
MSKSQYAKIANITYAIATVLFFIIIIIGYVKLVGSDYSYMHNLGLNWNRGPVSSVNPAGNACASPEQPLITNFWPGTNEGCYCTINTSLVYGPLRLGRCKKDRDNYIFCSTVPVRPPIRYQSWKNKFLCGKRVDTSYLDLTISRRPESCPMNMRSCGIVDSLSNVMCVPNQTPCPINSVSIAASNVAVTAKDSTVINAEGVKIVFSNNDPKGKILNELYIGENQPCANPLYANYNYKPYLLDYFYGKTQCTDKIGTFSTDERYIKLDTSNSLNTLRDNNILPIINSLPLYNAQSYNHETTLYSRNFIGLEPSCLQDLKRSGFSQNLLTDLTQIEHNLSWALGLTLTCLIFGIIMFVFMIFYLVMLCIMPENDNSRDVHKFSALMMILPFILELGVFIMSIIVGSFLKSYSNNHDVLTKQECVDPLTFAASSNFYPSVAGAKSFSVICIFISGLLLVVKIAQIFICCKDDEIEGFSTMDAPNSNTELAPQAN